MIKIVRYYHVNETTEAPLDPWDLYDFAREAKNPEHNLCWITNNDFERILGARYSGEFEQGCAVVWMGDDEGLFHVIAQLWADLFGMDIRK